MGWKEFLKPNKWKIILFIIFIIISVCISFFLFITAVSWDYPCYGTVDRYITPVISTSLFIDEWDLYKQPLIDIMIFRPEVVSPCHPNDGTTTYSLILNPLLWVFDLTIFYLLSCLIVRFTGNKEYRKTIVIIFIILAFIFILITSFKIAIEDISTTNLRPGNYSWYPGQLVKLAQKISIKEPKSGAIAIINIGTYNINATELSVYINGTLQTCNWSASVVEPTKVITADCTCTEGQIIKVTAPGNFDEDTCIA